MQEKKAAAAAEAIATRAQSSALVDDVIQSLRDGASESSPRRRVGTKARSAQRSGSKLNPLNAPSSGLVSPVSERGDPTEESNGLGTGDEEMRRQTAFAQSIKARLHGDGVSFRFRFAMNVADDLRSVVHELSRDEWNDYASFDASDASTKGTTETDANFDWEWIPLRLALRQSDGNDL